MARKALAPSRSEFEQEQLATRLRSSTAKTWAYIRVSSEGQEEGQSYDVQQADIVAFCKKNKLDPPEFIFEQASAKNPAIPISLPSAVSGAEGEQISPRPLLLMLLGFLCDHPNSNLVVWKLDRLARLAHEQEMILDILSRKGIRLHSTQAGEEDVLDRSKDSSDPARALFRHILGAVAQYERRVIEIRMRTGLRMKASKGEWVGGGRPFGYRISKKELVVDPPQAEIIRWIFYLRDLCGETYSRIAERLKSQLKVPGWHKVRISRVILNRQIYEGIYVDPYGIAHNRPDLRVLPPVWDAWLSTNNLTPTDSSTRDSLDKGFVPNA